MFASFLQQVEFEEFTHMSADNLRNCVIEYTQRNMEKVTVNNI